jgi:hypothetical protein
MDSLDHVQVVPTLVPTVVTPAPLGVLAPYEEASSPTAMHVEVVGQLTERSSPKPVASEETTIAFDQVQCEPSQLADAAMPCWLTLSPTATHWLADGQLTPVNLSIPVLPAGITAGTLHRQLRPTKAALAAMA